MLLQFICGSIETDFNISDVVESVYKVNHRNMWGGLHSMIVIMCCSHCIHNVQYLYDKYLKIARHKCY